MANEDSTGQISYKAVKARLEWLEGLIAISQGDPVEAQIRYALSLSLFEQLGERGNMAAVSSLLAEASLNLGDVDGSWKFRGAALSALAYLSSSQRAQLVLSESAAACLKLMQLTAALEFQNEAVKIAQRRGDGHSIADAHLRRIPIAFRLGYTAMALSDFKEVVQQSERIPASLLRNRLKADAWLERGRGGLMSESAQTIESLDAALSYYKQIGFTFPLVEIYKDKAMCHKESGLYDAAAEDLQLGLRQVESLGGKLIDNAQREIFITQAASIIDEMVELDESNNKPALALKHAELYSNLFLSVGKTDFGRPAQRLNFLRRRIGNSVVVRYYIVSNKLLIWSFDKNGERFINRTVSRAELLRAIRLVGHGRGESFERASALLFDLLIRPMRLAHDNSVLIVIPDKELWLVPFPALLDRENGRFLVEDRVVSINVSLASLRRLTGRSNSLPRRRLLAFGNPELPRDVLPSVLSLQKSEAEVEALRSLYSESFVALGKAADKETFLMKASDYDVLHLAVHGISVNGFNSLLLSPSSRSASGSLSGAELLKLKLRRTQIVVLAVCGNPDGPLANMAPYFLALGVPEVIASLWKVDDSNLTKRFFFELHSAVLSGLDAASALRTVQLRLLAEDRRLSRPSNRAWASFAAYGVVPTSRIKENLWQPRKSRLMK
jgi:CHAT domain-containing protein